MSQENVEALRNASDAARRGEVAAFVALLDRDVDWESRNSAAPPDLRGSYQGVEAVLQYFDEWAKAWKDWDWKYEEVEARGDYVISRLRTWGHGRRTGLQADFRFWQAWTFRSGKVIRYRDFDSKRDALEAVGLRE